ncbi:uncharacterized protein K489DRAFT_62318 [Dissoconium aciculare CBS 342.82]|uniref:Uncharacterized protein n=1 Tax=Dissoconium aciculare CBS 342.82 TaxID=1314786 RepID=A0A6J3LXC2_9PEZI|nr:uncharacterized protein K489DRAFT_62318 [Dissoconium aciculare CBS 342.82]KAF1819949.1 hypothetical protein K489DRAFT_62318 [Dissoconium aciculare CBS 342.82]
MVQQTNSADAIKMACHLASPLAKTSIQAAIRGEVSRDDVPDTRTRYQLSIYRGRVAPLNIKPVASIVEVINRRRTNVFENYNALREIWHRHGWTICKRWEKKSIKQRQNVLKQAQAGSIGSKHRPDLTIFCMLATRGIWQDHRDQRDVVLLPFINIEDLQNPRNLMVFMHARATNEPIAFAHMEEFLSLCDSRLTLEITDLARPCYPMLFKKAGSDQEYGRLIDMRDFADMTPGWLKSNEVHPVGVGLEILERQDKIWTFLTACAQGIMHDLPGVRILEAPQCSPIPSPPVDFRFASWSDAAELLPYSAPVSINLERMTRLLYAKCNIEIEHYWSLREDPSYFVETALWHSETPLDKKSWPLYVSNAMWAAFHDHRVWICLFSISRDLLADYGSEPTVYDFQDRDSCRPLMAIFVLLQGHLKSRIQNLWLSFSSSPRAMEFLSKDINNFHAVRYNSYDAELKIMTLLCAINGALSVSLSSDKSVIRLTMIIAEAQRLQETDHRASSAISSAMAADLAELATIAGPLRQIILFLSNYATTTNDDVPAIVDLDMHLFYQIRHGLVLEGTIRGPNIKSVKYTKNCGQDPSWFACPRDKPRTRETVERMRQAESRLDVLWSHFDTWTEREGLVSFVDRLIGLPPRVLHRTAPWNESEIMELVPKKASPQTVQDLADLYRDLEVNTERTVNTPMPTQAKIKLKTRGAGDRSSENECIGDRSSGETKSCKAVSADLASSPVLKVNSRALEAFKILFFTPSPNAIPGELSWNDFMYAMVSASFSAEKLYGSAWKFDSVVIGDAANMADDKFSNRSIIFHEPHPSNKIPYWIARRHGRRLTRAYGWTAETFVLAEKTVPANESV